MKPAVELPAITDDDEVVHIGAVEQRVTQLRTDAGGFAGRDYEWFSQ